MKCSVRSRIAALLITVGFAAVCEANGVQADILFAPVNVTIAPPARAGDFTIRNPSTQPLRLQISAARWINAPGNRIELAPTSDVIVFPQLVTVPGYGKQEIRIAMLAPPGDVEKTYRIVVDALPQAPPPGDRLRGAELRLNFRTQFTVPVMVEPLVSRVGGRLTAATARRDAVDFTLLNSGNTHLGDDAIQIIARDAAGSVVFSQPFRGWWVLAGDARSFSFHAPQDRCRAVRSITIAAPAYMKVAPKIIDVAGGVCVV
ncbi:MAG: molecular chaperone [Candidatus Eremiobacteraeota bacterium]|nr:molecular chaperone [Candidatus Eremiobacteraeota bacterium]